MSESGRELSFDDDELRFEDMTCMKCDGKPIVAGTGHCEACIAGRGLSPTPDAFADGMVTWGCCGRTEDERDYILFDHCRRCHGQVSQSTGECWRCPAPPAREQS